MMNISRRKFIQNTAMGVGGLFLAPQWVWSDCCNPGEDVVTETVFGKIRGCRINGVSIFKGVPYAGSVSGATRFQRPGPLKPWTGIRAALLLGPPAIQAPNQTYGIKEPDPAEDCLVLNIWTPGNDNRRRPVMFYNHGGGFRTGSGGSVAQDGANFARAYDVVVVQTNHRLGLMGYLFLDELGGEQFSGSGNMGMLDIVAGLEWVHDNIEVFGGDPDNVMIFGESGGGAKTSCLYAMPAAVPFFNKASIESGPGIRMTEPETAAETTRMLLKKLNISPGNWRKLLEVPVADLQNVQEKLRQLARQQAVRRSKGIGTSRPGGFGPIVDGVILPQHPFDPAAPDLSRNKPLIVGWNEDEYTFFGLVSGETKVFNLDFDGLQKRLEEQYCEDSQHIVDTYRKIHPEASASDIYVAVRSITMMGLGSLEIADKKTTQKAAAVYLYNFGYKSEVRIPGTDYPLGTPHAMDIQFKFFNVQPTETQTGESGPGMGGNRPERFAASRNFSELWATFARTGIPSAEDQPYWPPFNLETRPMMRIDSKCEIIYDRFHRERELWNGIFRSP